MKEIKILGRSIQAWGITVLRRTARIWSDKHYVNLYYKLVTGDWLNLSNPQTLNEKLNWLKLYDRKPIYTDMVDKYEAKKFVASRIGEQYVVKCLGVWNNANEIDWDKLPNKFVLKCTHDSGSVVVCTNKNNFDYNAAIKKLNRNLKKVYFYGTREWPYKNVNRRIIAEEYIEGLGNTESLEYKITCMNGEVKFFTICKGVAHSDYELRKNDHYTPYDWKKLDWYVAYKPSGNQYARPAFADELISLCEELSRDIPYLRVDWYYHNGKLYFGEMTFYTWAGFMRFEPKEWDKILGSWMTLPSSNLSR